MWDDKPARRKTYRTIAGDILSYMERQGLLVCDSCGWYRHGNETAMTAMTAMTLHRL